MGFIYITVNRQRLRQELFTSEPVWWASKFRS